MLLGFQDRFLPFVLDGSKRHTIRAGNRWKAGMRADLYARPRQKDMRLLFRAPVVKVERIDISGWEHWRIGSRGPKGECLVVALDGHHLDGDEAEALFRRDGFRNPEMTAQYEALLFWKQRLPFTGQIIHWDYDRRTNQRAQTAALAARK